MFINKEISKVIETGELKYNIILRYIDGSVEIKNIACKIAAIPQEPSEPTNNLSFNLGNKTIPNNMFSVPKGVGKLLVEQVKVVKPKKITKIEKFTTKRGFRK